MFQPAVSITVLLQADVCVCLREGRERRKSESDFYRIPESSCSTLDCSILGVKMSVPEVVPWWPDCPSQPAFGCLAYLMFSVVSK